MSRECIIVNSTLNKHFSSFSKIVLLLNKRELWHHRAAQWVMLWKQQFPELIFLFHYLLFFPFFFYICGGEETLMPKTKQCREQGKARVGPPDFCRIQMHSRGHTYTNINHTHAKTYSTFLLQTQIFPLTLFFFVFFSGSVGVTKPV